MTFKCGNCSRKYKRLATWFMRHSKKYHTDEQGETSYKAKRLE